MEWGIFCDESEDWTAEQAVEADFYSKEEAEAAIAKRYRPDDELVVHLVEEPDYDEECEGCGRNVNACDCEHEPRSEYPTKG